MTLDLGFLQELPQQSLGEEVSALPGTLSYSSRTLFVAFTRTLPKIKMTLACENILAEEDLLGHKEKLEEAAQ